MQDRVALGHRRLILDLASASQQPMIDSQLGLAIVFNGCIYNYRSSRDELSAKGHRFFSQGDTEVILKSLRPVGGRTASSVSTGCSPSPSGELCSGRVVLARDRLGIKPLYYAEQPGRFRFASTLAGTARCRRRRYVDRSGGAASLQGLHAVVPAPLTILKGVRKLPAATICTIEPDANAARKPIGQFRGRSAIRRSRALTEADWCEAIRTHAPARPSERRRVADVPVGVLLSGGLDSLRSWSRSLAAQGQKDLKDLFGRLRYGRRHPGRRIPLFRSGSRGAS